MPAAACLARVEIFPQPLGAGAAFAGLRALCPQARPIQPGSSYPAKEFCSHCGLCDTYYVAHVKSACAFLGDGEGPRRGIQPGHARACKPQGGCMGHTQFSHFGSPAPGGCASFSTLGVPILFRHVQG